MSVLVQGAWRTEAGGAVRVGGVWHTIVSEFVRVAGTWRQGPQAAGAFSATAPTEVDGFSYGFKPSNQLVRSNPASITVTGGKAPYFYSWTYQSGDTRISANSSTMATTTFSANLNNETATAIFAWTASDSNGNSANGTIAVNLEQDGD